MKKILVTTNVQKILWFLIQHPGKEYLEKEIQKSTKISKAGVNFALKDLWKAKLAKKQKRGKVAFYTVNYTHPVIKQLKVLKNILEVDPILEKLKTNSEKIILYGSCGRGEDTEQSDLDLFIVTNSSEEEILNMINKWRLKRKFQIVIRSPLKYVEMESNEPTFYREVNQGIVLWEKKE
jgi:predicted nucleotidyltransferase